MSERVRIGSCANPAEATLLRSFFDAHGVPIAINGEQHASMLGGLGGGFISLDISVSAEDAERASELLADFRKAAVDEQPQDEEDDDGGDELSLRLERRKRIGIAILLSCFVSFGTAHLSAGAYKRALALAVFEILAIRELVVHGPFPGALMLFAAIIYDAVGAVSVISNNFARRIPRAHVRK
jgi:Putative prokaryotic signal transducing protein